MTETPPEQKACETLAAELPFAKDGYALVDMGSGEAVIEIEMLCYRRQPAGLCRRRTATLIDTAMAYAVITACEGNTLDRRPTVHYLRPHTEGKFGTPKVCGGKDIPVSADGVKSRQAHRHSLSTYTNV